MFLLQVTLPNSQLPRGSLEVHTSPPAAAARGSLEVHTSPPAAAAASQQLLATSMEPQWPSIFLMGLLRGTLQRPNIVCAELIVKKILLYIEYSIY